MRRATYIHWWGSFFHPSLLALPVTYRLMSLTAYRYAVSILPIVQKYVGHYMYVILSSPKYVHEVSCAMRWHFQPIRPSTAPPICPIQPSALPSIYPSHPSLSIPSYPPPFQGNPNSSNSIMRSTGKAKDVQNVVSICHGLFLGHVSLEGGFPWHAVIGGLVLKA
ncbi:hypothetical protein F5B22DRAFT_183199 [Xylaria bambusicola]|uniref:uncharacterized protein n=1 Tax=Xylaria bambusicola TaxID=326684 RepID=UPI002007E2CE|nr:uncharacterized protein F5B22DRAFT_183199 [Xylaria bambusicola]KAI0516846.1 hypothetical protein F5B22DRAFT_183199 [Xylaria bambusicola]